MTTIVLIPLLCAVSTEEPEALNITVIKVDLGETQDDVILALGNPARTNRNGKLVELIYGAKVVTLVDNEVTTVWGDIVYANGHPLLCRGDSLLVVTKKLGEPDDKGYAQPPGEDQAIDVQDYRFKRKTLHVYSQGGVVTNFQLRANEWTPW